MNTHHTISHQARRAAMLRALMARLVRVRGRFRGTILGRLAHAIGRVTRADRPLLAGRCAFTHILPAPLNALADQGLGRAGGGGGGSGRL